MAQTLHYMLTIGDKIKMNNRLKNSGFSFMELMVAIAIIAVLSAFAIPNMIGWRADSKLRGAVSNLKGDLNMAKMMAVRENKLIVVLFSTNRYEVSVTGGNLIINRQLPAGVGIDLGASTFAGDQTSFNERGLPDPPGTVVVFNSNGDRREIELNRLGHITITNL